MKIIGDPGSCHLGNLTKARELVKLGGALGLDAVKFQLLGPTQLTGGNIGLDWEWMPELMAYGEDIGIEVFASVFDLKGLSYVGSIGCKSVKFAYGKTSLLSDEMAAITKSGKFYETLLEWQTIYASYDVMSADIIPGTIKLYCIPEYPVRYVIDFEGLFPRFDGFSDHTLGIQQTIRAAEAGAKYIEKHFQGDWYAGCPDGRFALHPKEMDQLVKRIKR